MEITATLDDEQIIFFCNILWCIWKARNCEIFSGKKTAPGGILKQAQLMEVPTQNLQYNTQPASRSKITISAPLSGTQIVLLDASWDANKKAGWGAVYYNQRGHTSRVRYSAMGAEDPFQAEAFALLQVLETGVSEGLVQRGEAIHIFSDCKTMVKALHSNEWGDLPCWKAAETIAACASILQQWGEPCILRNITRQALGDPHQLANMARRTEVNFDGSLWQGDRMGVTLNSLLSEEWFQISN